jgi:hypothetical protein
VGDRGANSAIFCAARSGPVACPRGELLGEQLRSYGAEALGTVREAMVIVLRVVLARLREGGGPAEADAEAIAAPARQWADQGLRLEPRSFQPAAGHVMSVLAEHAGALAIDAARCSRCRTAPGSGASATPSTGFGSFTYLQRLPVRYLKIDIEFVRDLTTNAASRHLVKAIVSLAKGFEQETIAEGVEDAQTLELLRDSGVDYAQGFHLGSPAARRLTAGPVGSGSSRERPD